MKKKEHFAKHFRVHKIFLELQCLVDDLVDLFRFINVSQCFFTLNILFDEVGRGRG